MTTDDFRNKPFFPEGPVPVEFFHGRKEAVELILKRGIIPVTQGHAETIFVQGEYGIGKSSIAGYSQAVAERDHGLHGIYATLSDAVTMDDVAEKIIAAAVQSGAFDPKRSERIRNWLGKYVGHQSLFGVSLNLDALKKDAPSLASVNYLLVFFRELITRLSDAGVKGVFLVLDEINGISSNAQFAHFLKGLVDTNALTGKTVPVLLMLCGVEERRWELISHHEPVGRIFKIVNIDRMSEPEMREFYADTFSKIGKTVDDNALDLMTHYAAGFPNMMQLIGDTAFRRDSDNRIDKVDAQYAVFTAASEVGSRYVTPQIYAMLRSKDYRSILRKISAVGPDMKFRKADVAQGLTESEKRKLGNFLAKLKQLKVIRDGFERGEYQFNIRMVRLFLWLDSIRETPEFKRLEESLALDGKSELPIVREPGVDYAGAAPREE